VEAALADYDSAEANLARAIAAVSGAGQVKQKAGQGV
jgi:hypothetical protein